MSLWLLSLLNPRFLLVYFTVGGMHSLSFVSLGNFDFASEITRDMKGDNEKSCWDKVHTLFDSKFKKLIGPETFFESSRSSYD